MKATILTTALVVIAALTFAQSDNGTNTESYALDTKNVKCAFVPSTNDMIVMYLEKAQGEKVKVRVSEKDNILYTKNLNKKDSVRVTYDISSFPIGTYTFELVKGKEVIYSKSFDKRDNAVALAK